MLLSIWEVVHIIGPMAIWISPRVRAKLANKHCVSETEIRQCFENMQGEFLRDPREKHQTEPPTYWFVAETNARRSLKIVCIFRKMPSADGSPPELRIEIKTAYDANATEIQIYSRHGYGDAS